jgi:hypothetical protein
MSDPGIQRDQQCQRGKNAGRRPDHRDQRIGAAALRKKSRTTESRGEQGGYDQMQ